MKPNNIIIPIMHLLYLANGFYLASTIIYEQWIYLLGSLALFLIFLVDDKRLVQ